VSQHLSKEVLGFFTVCGEVVMKPKRSKIDRASVRYKSTIGFASPGLVIFLFLPQLKQQGPHLVVIEGVQIQPTLEPAAHSFRNIRYA